MTSPPPPPLMDELVEEVLLRVPPDDPADLGRAAFVCKAWRRVASDPGFRRRYRERHGPAPMLGLLIRFAGVDPFVPTCSFRLPRDGLRGWRALDSHHGWRALDSRHGRVLVSPGLLRSPLAVWNPIVGELLHLPNPPWAETSSWTSWNWAVLCAAGGACDHLDCSRRPFLVALVGTNTRSVFGHVYSSEAGRWSQPTNLARSLVLDELSCAALVGNALYFNIACGSGILKYDFSTWEMSVINTPRCPGRCIVVTTTAHNGGLGLATIHGSRLHLWSWEAGPNQDMGWTQREVVELNGQLPADALTISPYLVGFMDRVEVFFFRAFNGLFGIDLKSGHVRKLHRGSGIRSVVPYVNFCTRDMQQVPDA
ncbi:hypothetical protein ACP70R_018180 [Stipagrostis hirtigluma subsp. patula]